MYEEVTISSTHPDCVEECLWCTNRVEAGTIAPQREGGSREAVLSENLCSPRTCALREPVPPSAPRISQKVSSLTISNFRKYRYYKRAPVFL